MYLRMVRSPQVSSLFDTSTQWRKCSVLFCMLGTTEFISLKGNLAFRKRTSNDGWRASMTVPTRLCRHGIPQQLPLIFTACHWQLQTATSDMQPDYLFYVPIYVLGTAPIKAPFDYRIIFIILKRSAFWCWLRTTCIRNYMVHKNITRSKQRYSVNLILCDSSSNIQVVTSYHWFRDQSEEGDLKYWWFE